MANITNISCAYGCEGGVCLDNETGNESDCQGVYNCSDSDPLNNLYTKGYVNWYDDCGEYFDKSDWCAGGGQLFQYNCTGAMNLAYDCPEYYVCFDGACMWENETDITPPVIDQFTIPLDPTGEFPVSLAAVAHDFESGMFEATYLFDQGPFTGFSNTTFCGGGDYCGIYENFSSSEIEPGWWNVTVIFTNGAGLSSAEMETIYVDGGGFLARIIKFFKNGFKLPEGF